MPFLSDFYSFFQLETHAILNCEQEAHKKEVIKMGGNK